MKYTALISDMLKMFPDLSPEKQAQQIDSYLTSSGYRILAPGEMDRETLKAAAKMAQSRHEQWRMPHPDDALEGEVCCDVSACNDIAAAIRALGGGEG
ncbi:hypothetical protein [uncultured Nitratireductor sp.]|uniref:hypothetical protein n=1 Tax=uncultured Nitratireductor sp. TaxID=520953 RepID=UPI0026381629|nr:hypothetical protein [uncultured Nitratireductor sp.]